MEKITSDEAFDSFVTEVARNNADRDGSNPRSVAECVITGIAVIGDGEATLSHNAGVYADERISPTDVLRHTIHDANSPTRLPNGYRQAAVDLLAAEIDAKQQELDSK
jgi:hypothetical protein